MMRVWLVDLIIGVAIGMLIAALVLLSSFNSTFIYRVF
jgi:hypothetical protein